MRWMMVTRLPFHSDLTPSALTTRISASLRLGCAANCALALAGVPLMLLGAAAVPAVAAAAAKGRGDDCNGAVAVVVAASEFGGEKAWTCRRKDSRQCSEVTVNGCTGQCHDPDTGVPLCPLSATAWLHGKRACLHGMTREQSWRSCIAATNAPLLAW